jgi:hypothetical protein
VPAVAVPACGACFAAAAAVLLPAGQVAVRGATCTAVPAAAAPTAHTATTDAIRTATAVVDPPTAAVPDSAVPGVVSAAGARTMIGRT